MKGLLRTAVLAVVLMGLMAGMLLAAEGERQRGEHRGTFLERVEKRVGDRDCLGIVLRLAEGGDLVTLLVPRENEKLMAAARELVRGQMVEVAYGVEDGQKWVLKLAAGKAPERSEPADKTRAEEGAKKEREQKPGGDKEHAQAQNEELRALVERLLLRIEKLEAEVKELRARSEEGRRADAARAEKERAAREGVKKEGQQRVEKPLHEGEGVKKEGERTDKPVEQAREGLLRCTFVRLVEKRMGELEYLALEVRAGEKGEPATLLIPKVKNEEGRMVNAEELAAKARALREGQKVEISWRWSEDRRWVRNIKAEGADSK